MTDNDLKSRRSKS